MGFLEKVKNMFTEEVVDDDDVKVEQIKQEVTHVEIASPNAKEEEISDFQFDINEKINKPVFFDDNDFNDLNLVSNEEVRHPKEEEKEVYNSKVDTPKEVEEKKVFKPTPIISPVYGILDKNYHKEDIVSRTEKSSNKKIESSPEKLTIDSIRNKAYGTLEDELENTLFGSNSILFKKEEQQQTKELKEKKEKEDILSNFTDDISKELDELLIKTDEYTDNNEDSNLSNDEKMVEDDLLGFIDSTLYKDGDEE